MAIVIVSHGVDANRWAQQFCRRPAWTRGSGMPAATGSRHVQLVHTMSRISIVTAIQEAARHAGAGGEILYSIGHGNSASVGATAQLGSGSELTINREILMADASGHYGSASGPTGLVTLSANDQAINTAFRSIGTALNAANVARFTFLTCMLGNNRSFLQQIKAAWGGRIQVAGYTAYVATMEYTMAGDSSYPRVSLYLSRDPAGANVVGGTNLDPASLLELPPTTHLTVV